MPPSIELAGQPAITLASIDSLWTGEGAARRGALIGGGFVGATATLVAYSTCTRGSGEPTRTGAVVLGATAAGAVIGAGVGAAIGSYNVRWHVYFARSPAQVGLGLHAAPQPPLARGAADSGLVHSPRP